MTETRKRLRGAYVRMSERRERRRTKDFQTFQDAAEAHALAALEALAALAQGAASESVRVSAANAVIDRAYGKPAPGAREAARDLVEPGGLEAQWLEPV